MPYRPRRRMIDPSLFDSKKLGKLTFAERWLFLCLISRQDDEGRLEADECVLRASAFKFDDIPLADVETMIRKLGDKLGCLYEVGGELYYQHDDARHWNPVPPTKFTPSKLPSSSDPAATVLQGSSVQSTLKLPAGSGKAGQEKRREEKRREDSPRTPESLNKGGEGELSTSRVDMLTIEFTGSPGTPITTKLNHYGFNYDRALRRWECAKPPNASIVFFDELTGDSDFEVVADGWERKAAQT